MREIKIIIHKILNEMFEHSNIKLTDEIANEVMKYETVEQLLMSGGISTDALDRAAFGFSESDIKTLQPKQLHVKWKEDWKNVQWEQEKSGLSKAQYAKKINLKEPIDVSYEKGKFFIEDGHHRVFAAATLKQPLNVNLEIKDNPIKKLGGGMGYDEFHKCVFNQVKNNKNISKETINETINKNPLKKTLDSNQAYALLDSTKAEGSTWAAGGCAILAFALNKLYDYPVYVLYDDVLKQADHFVVKTSRDTFIDYDGEQKNIIDNFKKREGITNKLILMPYGPGINTPGIVFDDKASEKLAQMIKGNSELIKESSSSEVKRLQKLLADKEKWFQYNGYGKPGHQYWKEKENEVKQIRQKLFDLTGDAYGISQADKDKKKIKPDGVDAAYNHPSEIPIDVYNWVSSNMSLLTSDATDAVRWSRIINTQDDSRYPRGKIMLYRAVDDVSYDEIRPGDWVTTDEKYAIQHNNKYFDGKGEIISMYVDGRDVLVSPTGNYEEAIYAPMALSGLLKKKIRENFILNEGELWRQGGMVLIKGAPLEDGSQRLFAATVVDTIELKPAQKAEQGILGVPGKSATNPVQMVILGNDFYRIKQDEFNLKAHKIDYRSDASLAKVLNFNKQKAAVVLNNNKTPFWWETLKFRDIATMFNQMGSQIMRAKNVNFYN